MDNDLTQRNVVGVAAVKLQLLGLWKSGGDNTCVTLMVVLRAPGLELRGESLGQTRVVIPGNGDFFLHRDFVGGIARIRSDCFFRVKTLILAFVVGSGDGGA